MANDDTYYRLRTLHKNPDIVNKCRNIAQLLVLCLFLRCSLVYWQEQVMQEQLRRNLNVRSHTLRAAEGGRGYALQARMVFRILARYCRGLLVLSIFPLFPPGRPCLYRENELTSHRLRGARCESTTIGILLMTVCHARSIVFDGISCKLRLTRSDWCSRTIIRRDFNCNINDA